MHAIIKRVNAKDHNVSDAVEKKFGGSNHQEQAGPSGVNVKVEQEEQDNFIYSTDDDDGFESTRPSSPASSTHSTVCSSPSPTKNARSLPLKKRLDRIEMENSQQDRALLELGANIVEFEERSEQYDEAIVLLEMQGREQKEKLNDLNSRLTVLEEARANSLAMGSQNKVGFLCNLCKKTYVNKYYLLHTHLPKCRQVMGATNNTTQERQQQQPQERQQQQEEEEEEPQGQGQAAVSPELKRRRRKPRRKAGRK